MTEFGTLKPDGTYTKDRTIPQSSMIECPHMIMAVEHYRHDNTCRCNDPDHTEMEGYGYTWNQERKLWV